VFNAGRAVPRETPPMLLRDVVSLVHDRTAARSALPVAS
jgi:hypothetical protein